MVLNRHVEFFIFLGILDSPLTISPSSKTAFNITLVLVDGITFPLMFKILLNFSLHDQSHFLYL